MSSFSLVYLTAGITIAWLLLHTFQEAWKRLRSRPALDRRARTRLLSHVQQNKKAQLDDSGLYRPPTSRIASQVGWFWLVISYHVGSSSEESSNAAATKRSSSSTRGRKSKSIAPLQAFYTVGTIVVLLAFLAVPAYLLATLYQTVTADIASTHAADQLDPVIGTSPSGLLIPGLSVPLRDGFSLFLAGFVAIAWHEAGHAVTAILAKVDITTYAFVLIFAFPGAYVALSAASLEALPSASARLRIIAAGVWHNMVLCCFVWTGMRMNVLGRDSGLYGYAGFKDMNQQGVVVQLVAAESPLAGLLNSHHLITHLDDVELHDSHTYKHWDNYLLAPENDTTVASGGSYDNLGFCVDREPYTALPTHCCLESNTSKSSTGQMHTKESRDVCFTSASDEGKTAQVGHCLDPGEILLSPRCTTSCSQTDQICIHPSPAAQLLRITVKDLKQGNEEVIMYQGQKRKLWNDVKIGRYYASFEWMQSVPLDIETFWLYTSSISLSLALFNLLPLPRLDGNEVLEVLLSTSTAFAPVLPMARDSKFGAAPYGKASREGRLEYVLDMLISTLQKVLTGGSIAQSASKSSRTKVMKRVVQVSVAILAGLNFLGILYGQLVFKN